MNRLANPVHLVALLLYLVPLAAVAQESKVPDEVKAQGREELQRAETASNRSENGGTDAAPMQNDVTIVAGKDSSSAKITYGLSLFGGRLIGTAATPVNKKEDATQFFSLEGPPEDLQLGLAWKRLSFGEALLDQIDLDELQKRRDRLCQEHSARPCDDTTLEAALKKEEKSQAEIDRTIKDFLAVKVKGQTGPVPIVRAIPIRYLSFASSLGRTERKFFDLAGTEKKDDRLSYSLSATFGRVFESSRWTATLASQRKYEEGKKARLCNPVAGSTNLEQCKEQPLKEAAKIDAAPLTLEYRAWFNNTRAISPKLVYDFQRKVFSGSLPIYLVADSDKKMNGGIRLDWEEGKTFSASIFVGSPLGLD